MFFAIFEARSLVVFSSLVLAPYSSNAMWDSDPSDRQSLSTYCVFLGGSLIA
jgi:hypothetical protein